MAHSGLPVCFTLVIVVSLVLLAIGFMDMFKHKPGEGGSELKVISQQLRGLGFFLLAMVVVSIGSALCVGGFSDKKIAPWKMEGM